MRTSLDRTARMSGTVGYGATQPELLIPSGTNDVRLYESGEGLSWLLWGYHQLCDHSGAPAVGSRGSGVPLKRVAT